MTATIDGPVARRSPLSRVWKVLTDPSREWVVIAQETGGARSLLVRYVLPLAAIGPVCGFAGALLFGVKRGALVFPPDPVSAGFGAASALILHLLGVFAISLAIDALAPSFDVEPNRVRAFKLAAYSATPVWLAGFLALFPNLFGLGIVGVYGVYLLYRGLPVMMGISPRRSRLYTALVAMMAMLMVLIAGIVPASITRINLVPQAGEASRWENRRFQFPGVESEDQRVAKVIEEAERKAKALKGAQVGQAPVSGDELQALLPGELAGGFARVQVSNATNKSAGMVMAKAKGVYAKGPARITLEVTDLGAASALAGLKLKSSSESATHYTKVGVVEGRLTSEEYDRTSRKGVYRVIVGGRFAVRADGEEIVIGDLKDAAASISTERLEAMSKG